MSSDYEVGYRKPPKHSRFKKGLSGNPKGRRKRASHSFLDILNEELKTFIWVVGKNGRQRITCSRAIIRQALTKALRGDAAMLIKLYALRDQISTADEPSVVEQDLEEIDMLIRQTQRDLNAE